MNEALQIINGRRGRLLGAAAATALLAVSTGGSIALLRRRHDASHNDHSSVRKRNLMEEIPNDLGLDLDGPLPVYVMGAPDPVIMTLPTPSESFGKNILEDPSTQTDSTIPMEFFDPLPPHTDPVEEFMICEDDVAFSYTFKRGEVTTCETLQTDRQASSICLEKVENDMILGLHYCPETCGMVDQCKEMVWGAGGGGGGGGDTNDLTELEDGTDTEGPRTEYWYPASVDGIRSCIQGAGYPESYAANLLFNARDDCCRAHPSACMEGETSGTEATSSTTPRTEYWYPTLLDGVKMCIQDGNYPESYAADLLFDTLDDCCEAYPSACMEGETSGTEATSSKITPSTEYWYPALVDGAKMCIKDANYPEAYIGKPEFSTGFLFDTRLECCKTFPSACKGLFWYPSSPDDTEGECVYGDDYPESMTDDPGYLFLSKDECCDLWCEGSGETATLATDATLNATMASTTLPTANNDVASSSSQPSSEPSSQPSSQPSSRLSSEPSSQPSSQPSSLPSSQTSSQPSSEPSSQLSGQTSSQPSSQTSSQPSSQTSSQPSSETSSQPSSETSSQPSSQTSSRPSTTPLDPCTECIWHESIEDPKTCTNSETYPPVWDQYPIARAYNFFHTAEDCCQTRYPQDCTVEDVHADDGTASGTGDDNACTECTWHESIVDAKTCTNSETYPAVWDQYPASRAYNFFQTAEECCQTRYPQDCTVEDVHEDTDPGIVGGDGSEELTPLGRYTVDDFEGDVRNLPFDFGTPNPQWGFDDTDFHSGSRSIVSQASDTFGDAADLTLKISVSQPSAVQCMAKIDIFMPYDMFYLEVDGVQRNTYHQKIEGWNQLMTAVAPGDHTIVFRVKKSEFDHGIQGDRAETYGTGRVWLDNCAVNAL